MKIHPLITDSAELAALCERLAKADFVCVDTEFMRENTYWPELCLIQIADTQEAAAIDPLAKGLDLSPLLDLLVDNEHVLKIFHAGGQDVEIIYNLTGKTPHPIFDTQIAMCSRSSMRAGDMTADTGHHHLLINTDDIAEGAVIPMDDKHRHFGKGQTETELTLPPGHYRLTMQFADGAHRSYGDKLRKTIEITVK